MKKINYNKLFFTLIVTISNIIAITQSTVDGEMPDVCPTIISKSDWGGNIASSVDYLVVPLQYVVIHHTASQPCTTKSVCTSYIQNIQAYHQTELDYWDIGYNFLIGNDGNVYEGAGWHKQGAHTWGYNKKSIGIAFVGNYASKLPTQKALRVAKKFLQCAIEMGEVDENYKLYGGRQLSATESPGLKLYQEIQNWANYKRIVE